MVILHSSRAGEWLRWLLLAGLTVLLDHVVKLSVVPSVPPGTHVETASSLNLMHAHNPGAAFNFLAGTGGQQCYFFITLTLAALAWLIRILRRNLP